MNSKMHTMIWGSAPSTTCLKLWEYVAETQNQHFLVYGIGDGRNAKFLAEQGFEVVAVDSDNEAIESLKSWAKANGAKVNAITGNLETVDIGGPYDIVLSVGVLNRVDPAKRSQVFDHLLAKTKPGGYNAVSVFVDKPFIRQSQPADIGTFFKSGELVSYYQACNIIWTNQELFRGNADDVFCVDRVIAKKMEDGHIISAEEISQSISLV